MSLIDAKNENIYGGLFEFKNSYPKPIQEYFSDSIDSTLQKLQQQNQTIHFVGNASIVYQDKIKTILKEKAIFLTPPILDSNSTSIGIAGFDKWKKNPTLFLQDVNALYLRPSNAERTLGEKK